MDTTLRDVRCRTPQGHAAAMAIHRRPVLVAISGGSGAGKTTLAEAVQAHYGHRLCERLPLDAYYKHYDTLTLRQREALDWETADTVDIELLTTHLLALDAGQMVEIPDFDFTVRLRSTDSNSIRPPAVLVVEGLFALAIDHVIKTADLRVFVETPEHVRYQRRYERDVALRGRSPESVHDQWVKTVCPGHRSVVEPQRLSADMIVNGALPVLDMLTPITEQIDAILLRHPASGSP